MLRYDILKPQDDWHCTAKVSGVFPPLFTGWFGVFSFNLNFKTTEGLPAKRFWQSYSRLCLKVHVFFHRIHRKRPCSWDLVVFQTWASNNQHVAKGWPIARNMLRPTDPTMLRWNVDVDRWPKAVFPRNCFILAYASKVIIRVLSAVKCPLFQKAFKRGEWIN